MANKHHAVLIKSFLSLWVSLKKKKKKNCQKTAKIAQKNKTVIIVKKKLLLLYPLTQLYLKLW